MKSFITRIAAVILCLAAISPVYALEVTRLTLSYKDGTEKHFNIPDSPVMSFDGDKLVVKTSTMQTEALRSEIDHYRFTKAQVGVETPDAETDYVFGYANNIITITGTGLSTLKVYDLQGRLVLEAAPQADAITADLSSLTPGVYVAAVDGRTSVKVVVR